MEKFEQEVKNDIFGFGSPNTLAGEHFTGDSFLTHLVLPEGDVNVHVGTINFAPGVRNDWHIHRGGYQIIIATSGEGWAQIEGQPAQSLRPGDTVVFHDGVKHWHGAKEGSWFTHIAITKGETEWLERVSDSEFRELSRESGE